MDGKQQRGGRPSGEEYSSFMKLSVSGRKAWTVCALALYTVPTSMPLMQEKLLDWCSDSRLRYTFLIKIREKFPVFDGASRDVSISKSFTSLLAYGTNGDPKPFVWGEPMNWNLVEFARKIFEWREKKKVEQLASAMLERKRRREEELKLLLERDRQREEELNLFRERVTRLTEINKLLLEKRRQLEERKHLAGGKKREFDEKERELDKKLREMYGKLREIDDRVPIALLKASEFKDDEHDIEGHQKG